MFYGASAFNQDIGNWDVSNGEDFVSIIMNTNAAIYNKSNHITHNILLYFAMFTHSLGCLKEHYCLTKTLVIGMFPMVFGL